MTPTGGGKGRGDVERGEGGLLGAPRCGRRAARERVELKDGRREKTMPASTLATAARAFERVEERVRRGFRICSRLLRRWPEEAGGASCRAGFH